MMQVNLLIIIILIFNLILNKFLKYFHHINKQNFHNIILNLYD